MTGQTLLEMVIVTIFSITQDVLMMVVIVVEQILIHNIVQNAFVMKIVMLILN